VTELLPQAFAPVTVTVAVQVPTVLAVLVTVLQLPPLTVVAVMAAASAAATVWKQVPIEPLVNVGAPTSIVTGKVQVPELQPPLVVVRERV
jgi:hypothetical protein